MPLTTIEPRQRRWLWPVLKWLLFGLVLFFVFRRGYELWNPDDFQDVRIRPSWLVLSGLAYLIGWLPSLWFWQRLTRVLGDEISLHAIARAYYCGHLGKYVPGKATVLVIRSALLKNHGGRLRTTALTAAYETLAVMGAGAAVAVSLAPLMLTDSHWQRLPSWMQFFQQHPTLLPIIVIIGTVALLPVIAALFTRLAWKMVPRDTADFDHKPAQIGAKLIAIGLLLFVLAWTCHGLSLGFALKAISEKPLNLTTWTLWTGVVSLATVGGFFAIFAPGGVGVREGVLIEMIRIQPEITGPEAVAAALILRMVWLLAEIGAAGALYYLFVPSTIVTRQKSPDYPV